MWSIAWFSALSIGIMHGLLYCILNRESPLELGVMHMLSVTNGRHWTHVLPVSAKAFFTLDFMPFMTEDDNCNDSSTQSQNLQLSFKDLGTITAIEFLWNTKPWNNLSSQCGSWKCLNSLVFGISSWAGSNNFPFVDCVLPCGLNLEQVRHGFFFLITSKSIGCEYPLYHIYHPLLRHLRDHGSILLPIWKEILVRQVYCQRRAIAQSLPKHNHSVFLKVAEPCVCSTLCSAYPWGSGCLHEEV